MNRCGCGTEIPPSDVSCLPCEANWADLMSAIGMPYASPLERACRQLLIDIHSMDTGEGYGPFDRNTVDQDGRATIIWPNLRYSVAGIRAALRGRVPA